MSSVYSSTRPPFANGPQTPLYKSMADYAVSLLVDSEAPMAGTC